MDPTKRATRLLPEHRKRINALRAVARGAILTRTVIEWILRPDNRAFRAEILDQIQGYGDTMIHAMLKVAIMRQLSPLADEPAPRAELHARLLEAGLWLVDWDEVEAQLEAYREEAD